MSGATLARDQRTIGKALSPELQKALGKVTEISSLPEITTKIVEIVEDPRASARDMHEIIKRDPALAAKILKVVNSAFYGLPAQIASLDRAIMMLGLSAVKNIALAASLSRMFKADAISSQFAARDVWKHCISVAVGARALASATKFAQVDEAFVAGLVHDMGLIVAQQLNARKLREVAERCYNNPEERFCAVEEAVIGADHQALGSALAGKWRFPPGLRYTIAYHHEPLTILPEFRRIVAIIYVADTLCSERQFGFYLTARSQPLSDDVLAAAGLSADTVAAVAEELTTRVEEAEQILAIG